MGGVRDLETVEDAAIAESLTPAAVTQMPADDLTLGFTKKAPRDARRATASRV